MTTLLLRKSISRSPLRLAFLLMLACICFALSPTAQAVSPPPDGGYPNNNTAEGDSALLSLSTGDDNTANGFEALKNNTVGNFNTAIGSLALHNNTTGTGNTAIGDEALFSNTTGLSNVANGLRALHNNTLGADNIAIGPDALGFNTGGFCNIAIGMYTMINNRGGSFNTAIGVAALSASMGFRNIALGYYAGTNVIGGSNNIHIGNEGVFGDNATIRIGGDAQERVYIAGIYRPASFAGTAVYVNSNGQLGTATSSARFKRDIQSMETASETILALRPVTFRYKPELDPTGLPQFGLVAEDVEKVNPALVVRDADGKPYSVRYEAVNAMLLNEFLREHNKVGDLEKDLRATIVLQRKEIKALTASLKEQASQIQKVSAQLQVSKSAPQMVVNDQ